MKRILVFISFLAIFGRISAKEYKQTIVTGSIKPTLVTIDTINFISFVDGYATNIGMPMMPVKLISYNLLRDEVVDTIEVHYNNVDTITLDHKILPLQIPIETSINRNSSSLVYIDKSVYADYHTYPSKTYIYRIDKSNGSQTLSVYIYLAQYNSGLNQFIQPKSIDITIYTHFKSKHSPIASVEDIIDKSVPHDILSNSISSPISLPLYEYTIITSEALKPSFEKLICWKRQKGYNAGIVTMEEILSCPDIIGDTNSNIYDEAGKLHQYLQIGLEYIPTKYVLLGGDYTIVPIRYGTEYNNGIFDAIIMPTDWYYSDYDFNWNVDGDSYYGEPTNDNMDYGAELSVGRVLCSTPQDVETWIEKQLLYEKNPGNGDYTYLTKGLFLQQDQMQSGHEAESIISLLPTFDITLLNETPDIHYPTSPKGADIIDLVNSEHFGLISNFNHGHALHFTTITPDTGSTPSNHMRYGIVAFDNYDESEQSAEIFQESGNGFDNLNNYLYPSLIYSISCTNMPFDDYLTPAGRNLAESFTCANRGGGIAYLGNTRSGYVYYSTQLYKEFVKALKQSVHIGDAENISKSLYAKSLKHYLVLVHNLVGCPETPMWTQIPMTFTNITTYWNNGILQIKSQEPNAKICVSSSIDNAATYHSCCITNNVDSVYIFNNVPESYVMVVTKDNYIPYIEDRSTLYIQNKIISENKTTTACKVNIGYDVTTKENYGNVKVLSGGSLSINYIDEVFIKNNTTIEKGATLNINHISN